MSARVNRPPLAAATRRRTSHWDFSSGDDFPDTQQAAFQDRSRNKAIHAGRKSLRPMRGVEPTSGRPRGKPPPS
jgi:hypothetical protein